jgi:chemotaxis protein methyltransferase CheR
MRLSADDFAYLQRLAHQLSGLLLDPQVLALAETRLIPVLRSERLEGYADLVTRLRSLPEDSSLHRRVVEALANHETSFFRDLPVFEALRTTVLPALLEQKARTRELNIWCAACSFGQEPYSIAMLLEEAGPQLAGWTVRLLATDFSEAALHRARQGRYEQLEINRGLPARLLVKYVRPHMGQWVLREDLCQRVRFQVLNLLEDFTLPEAMDLIFLRNVMIYWDAPTRQAVLSRVRRKLTHQGYLVLGAAETISGMEDTFERIRIHQSSWYRPRGGAPLWESVTREREASGTRAASRPCSSPAPAGRSSGGATG